MPKPSLAEKQRARREFLKARRPPPTITDLCRRVVSAPAGAARAAAIERLRTHLVEHPEG